MSRTHAVRDGAAALERLQTLPGGPELLAQARRREDIALVGFDDFELADLLAIDPIVNQAAKWHYMFGGQASVPLVIRMVVGRGWGQGPQHSQSLQALFAHVPGLVVTVRSERAGRERVGAERDDRLVTIANLGLIDLVKVYCLTQ